MGGVTFGVQGGECFGLLGANGAGKTSIFRLLTGGSQLSAGTGAVDGHGLNSGFGAKGLVGYCPQFDALCELLTAREHLLLHGVLLGLAADELPKMATDLLLESGLAAYADYLARELSYGNRRKLSLSIALLGTRPLLCLDEPSTGLDPKARLTVNHQIELCKQQGRAVLLTSHAMNECEGLCDRIGIMVNGKLVCLGTPAHLQHKFGLGYTLVLKCSDAGIVAAKTKLQSAFTHCALEEEHRGFLHYTVPVDRMPPLGTSFNVLENLLLDGHIEDYELSRTTMEEIFCKLVQAQRELDARGSFAADMRTLHVEDDELMLGHEEPSDVPLLPLN